VNRVQRCRSLPPNWASPMRGSGIVLGTCGAGRECAGRPRQTGCPCDGLGPMRRSGWCETRADVWVGVMRFQGWCRTGWCMRLKAIETGAAGRDSPRRTSPTTRWQPSRAATPRLGLAVVPPGSGSTPGDSGGTTRNRVIHIARDCSWWVSSPGRSQGQDPAAIECPTAARSPRLSSARSSGRGAR
jgi:hypothetical protein